MQPLDYQSKSPARRRWFSTRYLILFVIGLASMAAAAGMAWSRHQAAQLQSMQLWPQGEKPILWESYGDMHKFMLARFVDAEGFGHDRLLHAADWNPNGTIEVDGKIYDVGTVQLISLNDGKQPFVYVADPGENPDIHKLKGWKHGVADQSAIDALEELKQGKEVVTCGTNPNRRLIGAVRAAESCLKCHADVKLGTLMGAFNYPLH